MFVLPERDSFGRRVIFHIPRCKNHPSSILTVLTTLLNQAPGPLSPLNGGCDQSNCHHSRNPSWGRGEPNQVSCCSHLVSEPFHHPGDLLALWTPANSPWLIWLSGILSRFDLVSNNSTVTLPILQLRRVINLCEKGIPMRHKGVNYIHLPSFVTTMFNFVKGILSKKIQNRSKYWWKYKQNDGYINLGSTSTTVWVSWKKGLEVSKCFQRNMGALFLFPQWPGA